MTMDEARTLVDDCENRQSRLTDWETTFISDMGDILDDDRPLSDGQLRKLEQIWERVTENG